MVVGGVGVVVGAAAVTGASRDLHLAQHDIASIGALNKSPKLAGLFRSA